MSKPRTLASAQGKVTVGCRLRLIGMLLLLGFLLSSTAAQTPAASPEQRFEEANALYETGRHVEAAAAYQALANDGVVSPALYLNLGNAWFKAGQQGRAVAAYRLGLQLAPRDPDLRFNLTHVRDTFSAEPVPIANPWSAWLTRLTIHEWTVLFLLAYWTWGLLLVAGEWRPAAKATLRGYTSSAGAATGLLLVSLCLAAHAWTRQVEAVVVVPEAVVRYGPLEASKMYFQLNDGEELVVLDEKAGETDWFRIRAGDGREGWVKREELALLTLPRRNH